MYGTNSLGCHGVYAYPGRTGAGRESAPENLSTELVAVLIVGDPQSVFQYIVIF